MILIFKKLKRKKIEGVLICSFGNLVLSLGNIFFYLELENE